MTNNNCTAVDRQQWTNSRRECMTHRDYLDEQRKIQQINLKVVSPASHLTKLSIKVATQLKLTYHNTCQIGTLVAYNICSTCPPVAVTQHVATVWLRCRSITRWLRRWQFVATRNSSTFGFVNSLLKNAPYLVMDRIQVWTIWRPQWRRDEVWCQEL